MNYFPNKFCAKWIIPKDCTDVDVLVIGRSFGYPMTNAHPDVVFSWHESYGTILWHKQQSVSLHVFSKGDMFEN